jgi:F0F1-type ATP synthase membrane subunit c/vacuolar-type H+-ATPase subunit K
LLFVKAAKILAASFAVAPLSGCAIATGLIYGCFLIAASYAPDRYNAFFSASLLAFAFVETFCFMALGLAIYLLFA